MKRVIICLVLLVMVMSVSVYSHFKVKRVSEEMNTRIDLLMEMLPSGDHEAVAEQSMLLTDYWNEQEEILVHFTRHVYLDMVTTSVTRLPFLAAYGDFAEFSAELSSIRRQMEHIHGTEILTFDNLM